MQRSLSKGISYVAQTLSYFYPISTVCFSLPQLPHGGALRQGSHDLRPRFRSRLHLCVVQPRAAFATKLTRRVMLRRAARHHTYASNCCYSKGDVLFTRSLSTKRHQSAAHGFFLFFGNISAMIRTPHTLAMGYDRRGQAAACPQSIEAVTRH